MVRRFASYWRKLPKIIPTTGVLRKLVSEPQTGRTRTGCYGLHRITCPGFVLSLFTVGTRKVARKVATGSRSRFSKLQMYLLSRKLE
jgi:hypothetical protein